MSEDNEMLSTEELVAQNEEIVRAIESVPQQLERLRQQLSYNSGILAERQWRESQAVQTKED